MIRANQTSTAGIAVAIACMGVVFSVSSSAQTFENNGIEYVIQRDMYAQQPATGNASAAPTQATAQATASPQSALTAANFVEKKGNFIIYQTATNSRQASSINSDYSPAGLPLSNYPVVRNQRYGNLGIVLQNLRIDVDPTAYQAADILLAKYVNDFSLEYQQQFKKGLLVKKDGWRLFVTVHGTHTIERLLAIQQQLEQEQGVRHVALEVFERVQVVNNSSSEQNALN